MNTLFVLLLISAIISIVLVLAICITKTKPDTELQYHQIPDLIENNLTISNLKITDNSKSTFIYSSKLITENEFELSAYELTDFSPEKVTINLTIGEKNITKTVSVQEGGTFSFNINDFENLKEMQKTKTMRLVKTYKSNMIPSRMLKSCISFMNINPGYDLFYYDDDTAREFLVDNFSEDVVDAYDCLIPGAFKADLFRLAELYINGGIYSDASMICIDAVDFRDFEEDLILVKDLYEYPIYNALIVAKSQKIELLNYFLQNITKRVLEKYHPNNKDALSYTGPGALGILLNKYDKNPDTAEIKYGKHKYGDLVYLLKHVPGTISDNSTNKKYIKTKYSGWEKERQDSIHYSILVKNDLVYKKKVEDIIINNNNICIFQTWETKWVSKKMYDATLTLKQLNPEFNYRFFSNDDRRKLIKDNFSEKIYKAYNSLIPGAYRADIWRLCVLHIYGGFYCDADMVCLRPLKTMLNKPGVNFIAVYGGKNQVDNGFIWTKPGHPVLMKCLELATENILNKVYFESDLELTGPHLLGKIIGNMYGSESIMPGRIKKSDIYLLKRNDKNSLIVEDINGEKYFKVRYNGYLEERILMGGTSWANSHKKKKIFRD